MILGKEMGVFPGWLVFEDEEMTVVEMETAVEEQLTERRLSLGRPPTIDIPTFGYLAPMPELPENNAVSQTLYHHLRLINEMEAPETTPVLAMSPATRIPCLRTFMGIHSRASPSIGSILRE